MKLGSIGGWENEAKLQAEDDISRETYITGPQTESGAADLALRQNGE